MTGNSIYYAPPNDILPDARILARSDGWELRFDFTLESTEKITETVRRALSPENADSPSRSSTGYGFSHPIF